MADRVDTFVRLRGELAVAKQFGDLGAAEDGPTRVLGLLELITTPAPPAEGDADSVSRPLPCRRGFYAAGRYLDGECEPERVGDALKRGDGRTDASSFETSDCRLAGAHPFGKLALCQ